MYIFQNANTTGMKNANVMNIIEKIDVLIRTTAHKQNVTKHFRKTMKWHKNHANLTHL
jgi:hypothetical protein